MHDNRHSVLGGAIFDESYRVRLAPAYLTAAHEAVERWQRSVPPENTGVYQMFDVPSLVVSVDCAPCYIQPQPGRKQSQAAEPKKSGYQLNILDIGPDPGGLGLVQLFHEELMGKLMDIRRFWPEVKFLASPRMANKHDYNLWLTAAHFPKVAQQAELLFIIAEPAELPDYGFASLSASPLLNRWDKSYGLGWLWETKSLKDFDYLDWQTGFCLKSNQGYMRGLHIFRPDRCQLDRQHIHGGSTRQQIYRVLAENNAMYYQPFVEAVFASSHYPTVHRLFFLYDAKQHKYVYGGGVVIRRNNLKACSLYQATLGLIN
jgi:hypothetical protein